MSKNAAVFAGVLIVRRGRLYVQPQNASWGQRLSRLPFPEGAALYRAVLRFVERTGTTIPVDAKVLRALMKFCSASTCSRKLKAIAKDASTRRGLEALFRLQC